VTRTGEFEELRPLLFAIAYRLLGSVSEAEDAVQDTWLRYEASPAQPTSTKAFLSAAVTRISIDVLRSARSRREKYVGQWLPEPLLTDPYGDPERSAELADSVSMAALLLLERLSPLERAVFVLREVFGFSFPEVASAVGRSAAACRQPAGSDLPRSGQQGSFYLDARRTRRADPDDPLGEQPRQARARGSGGRRLGDRPRGEPGAPAHGLTGRAQRQPAAGGSRTGRGASRVRCPRRSDPAPPRARPRPGGYVQ
jgi:RNA polymerase sigma factor (sigma-70 family)